MRTKTVIILAICLGILVILGTRRTAEGFAVKDQIPRLLEKLGKLEETSFRIKPIIDLLNTKPYKKVIMSDPTKYITSLTPIDINSNGRIVYKSLNAKKARIDELPLDYLHVATMNKIGNSSLADIEKITTVDKLPLTPMDDMRLKN